MRQRNRIVIKRISAFFIVLSLLAGCLMTAAAAEPPVPEGAVLPEWYSFPEDALSLFNDSRSVGLPYYIDVYGPLKGRFLYDLFEANGSHGLCYGISFAEGAILADDPGLASFHTPDGAEYGAVNELKKGSVSDAYGLTLSDIIKYVYVSQASAEVADNYRLTKNDPEGLRAAVYDFVYHGGPPVAVGLLGNFASHEVLAVGLLGDEDVVISDSNDPSRLYVLDFMGAEWEYRCGGYTWRSGSADFDYCTDILSVIGRLSGEAVVSDPSYTYNETEENDAVTDIYVSDYVCYDLDRMLLMVPDDFDYTPKEIASHVGFGDSTYFDVNYDFDYLWADAEQAVVTMNESQDPRTLVIMGNKEGIMTSVLPGHIAAVTAADDSPSLLLKGDDGQEVLFAGFRLDENDELEFLLIGGVFDGDEVFTISEDGLLYVSGLRSVTAVVETMSGRQSESVTSVGGEMLIGGDIASGVDLTLLGDADGDGRVTSSDARITLRCSVKLENVADYDALACDYDMDDSVTSADARLILRRSVGLRD